MKSLAPPSTRRVLSLWFCAALFCVAETLDASVPVNVTVESRKQGDLIPKDFSGLSFETFLMLPNEAGIRYFHPDNFPLLNLFHILGIRSLRIGGNTGDRDARKLPGEADIDSLFAFAKAADVKVIYCLRLHNGDPDGNAKTARYIADHFAPQLECFSIGQEPSAYPVEKIDSRPISERMGAGAEKYSYRDFSDAWAKFAEPIVKAVPNVKFSGPGVHNNPDWTRRFIAEYDQSRNVGMATVHLYPGGPGGKVISPEVGRNLMLSDEFTAACKRLHDGIVPVANAKTLPYRLEETNSFFNGGAADVSNTFTAALWGLDYMWWWASHGAAGVNFHTGDRVAAGSQVQQCKYSAFYSKPNGCAVQPLGYGIAAFNLGRGIRLLPATVNSADSVRLSVYAAVQDKRVLITLINKEHGPSARDLEITLSTDAEIAKAESVLLSAPNGDIATNSGITLGGGAIEENGSWSGRWTVLERASGELHFKMAPASAIIIKVNLDAKTVTASREPSAR